MLRQPDSSESQALHVHRNRAVADISSSALALCLADLHSSKTALARLDSFLERRAADLSLVLAAGDITIPGHEDYAEAFIDVVQRHAVPLLLVHGNNDTPRAVQVFRDAGVTIHRGERTVDGVRFVGFGGDGNAPHDTELAEGESLALDPSGAILLTHVPPRVRLAYGPDRAARRSASRGAAVPELSAMPRAHVCGHIHHTEGVAFIGPTKIVKLRAAMWNRCALLNLASLAVEFLDLDPTATRRSPLR